MIKPKDIVLKRVKNADAKRVMLAKYRSGTFPSGVMLSLGCFVGPRCLGVVVFSIGSQFIHTVIQNGNSGDVWELARLWLSDELPRNSESRVLSVAVKLAKQFNPELTALVTYTDKGVGLYKGAGWSQVPGRYGDRRSFTIDGVDYFSTRAITSQFGTMSKVELEKRGHRVEVKEGLHRTKWIYWLKPGELAINCNTDKHPLEPQVYKLWRPATKWLGPPGSETIRNALYNESYVAEFDEEELIGIWLFTRLKKKAVFRGMACVVAESARGKGVGKKLLAGVKTMADNEGRIFTFDCKVENPAIAFWRQSGFQEVGQRCRGKENELYSRFVYSPIAPKA